MTSLTKDALAPLGVKPRDADRSKNFFALGLVSWMYTRPVQPTLDWIAVQVRRQTQGHRSQHGGLQDRARLRRDRRAVRVHLRDQGRPRSSPGTYTNINGNTALAWGLVAAGQLAELPVFLGSYPITPASDILHELSKHKNFGVRTLQAEDEIAAIGAALGAAYGGHLGVTTTSGPGLALKGETIGLAVSLELPLIIIDIQRGGPSTGLPTKTEAADLLQAMYGRHGESPLPDRRHPEPGALLRRGHRGGPHRPQVPHAGDPALRRVRRQRHRAVAAARRQRAARASRWTSPPSPTTSAPDGEPEFWPYLRDPETLARPWAVPGTPGLMHRIGGIEKEDGTGNICYDPDNHERMTHLRAARIDGIADDIDPTEMYGDVDDAEILVLGWGSTWGSISGAVDRVRARGRRVGPRPPHPGATPSPATWATCSGATRRCWSPR